MYVDVLARDAECMMRTAVGESAVHLWLRTDDFSVLRIGNIVASPIDDDGQRRPTPYGQTCAYGQSKM